ncbi:HAD family hydrolase [candidate division KSB1 bacterium]|nr:HAD family hydrolase [candidate division KSB1 bacterium]NIR71804.1 HAD family hydrolase [candidate division KSB1 bacterium]NIS27258.1 HAD family hydrolase [candidate division KSB1 bacterium]NIT74143.1 HAD family hydrolase [candidate division KSB1 bacterium]NIU27992.1 HAD family hydrolase [candidate division KSB1 bacterium]
MKLLLFDVDLTLVNTGGAGRRAMARAFKDIFQKDDGMEKINFAGRTDRAIFRDALTLWGLQWQHSLEERFKRTYLEYLQTEIRKPNPKEHIEPGVLQLLQVLSNRSDVTLGLLTGNWRSGAKIKLEHFNLFHYFRLGAFADDSENRNKLPEAAVKRFEKMFNAELRPEDVYIIGDTPLDVACARSFAARSVAVATGFFSFEELQASKPDFLFKDLSDTQEFLDMLNGRL